MNSIKFACDGVSCTAEVAACVGPVAVLRGTGTDSGRWFARGAFGARSFRAEEDARSLAAYYARDAQITHGSASYEAAYQKAMAASKKFREAQQAYRSRKIDDREFLAAKSEYERSQKEFDQARGERNDADLEYDCDAAPEFHTGEATPERNQRARLDQLEKRYDLGGLGPEELAEYRHLRELVSSDDEPERINFKSAGATRDPATKRGPLGRAGSGLMGGYRDGNGVWHPTEKREPVPAKPGRAKGFGDDDPQLALSNRGVDADPKKRAERLLQEIIDSTSDSDVASQAQRAYMRGDFKTVERIADSLGVSGDAPVSEAQRRAMGAAMSGHSNLGIPKSVGKEFIDKDPGGALPSKAGDDVEPPSGRGPNTVPGWHHPPGQGTRYGASSYGGLKKTTFDPEFERAHPQTSRPDKYGSFRGGEDATLRKRQVEAQRAAMLERGVLCP